MLAKWRSLQTWRKLRASIVTPFVNSKTRNCTTNATDSAIFLHMLAVKSHRIPGLKVRSLPRDIGAGVIGELAAVLDVVAIGAVVLDVVAIVVSRDILIWRPIVNKARILRGYIGRAIVLSIVA